MITEVFSANPVKTTETYDVQLYLRKITQKDKSVIVYFPFA